MNHSTLDILCAVLASGLLAATSLAQSSSACGVTALGVMIYGGSAKTDSPFSVTIQTTHDQQLTNGNAIHAVIVTHAYRDSAGRIRQEISGMCGMGLDGQFHPTVTVSVNDPTGHTVTTWQVNGHDKVARLRHQEEQPPSSAPPLTAEQRTLNGLIEQHWRKNTHSENLGSRTIAGVSCDDTRQTTTTPAGEQGNELPIDLKEEVCIARDTGISMLRIEDYPLRGHTQTEVTDYSPTEPDLSVFTPPPGYTVEEQPLKPVSAASR